MSKAKQIGTAAETGVKKALLRSGYTPLEAHRNVLAGAADEGDVWLRSTHGLIVFEVKGGKMAKTASHEQVLKWFEESQKEKKNANGNFGFLVTQRGGFSADRSEHWWAYARLGDVMYLRTYLDHPYDAIVRLTLGELVQLIRG
jgi:hypothetical protein